MMLMWMAYALLVGGLTALAAFAVDRACRLARIPTRWVWAAAIALAIGLADASAGGRRVRSPCRRSATR